MFLEQKVSFQRRKHIKYEEKMINMTFKNFHTRKYTKRKIKRQGEDICKPRKVTYQCVEYLKIPYKSVRKDKQIELRRQKGNSKDL